MYNSGTHCPLIVRIPEKFKHLWPAEAPGATVDRLVSFVDMPATWISLAGGKIPSNYHGRVFLGEKTAPEADYHFSFRGRNDERIENVRALHDKQFLYVKNYIPYVPRGQHLKYQWKIPMQRFWEAAYKAGRTDPHQSRFFEVKDRVELYNTQKDPFCLNNLAMNPEFQEQVERFDAKLQEKQHQIYDAGLIPESEVNKRAADKGMTVYELVRKKSLYNLPAYQQAADIALENSPENISQLMRYLRDSDSGIRYWGATGLMMLGPEAAKAERGLTKALADSSHNVRIMAAWALIKQGNNAEPIQCIRQMLRKDSYAMMEILNVIDWMGEPGKTLKSDVSKTQEKWGDIGNMRNYLINK